jgi:hypothetical protein
VLATGNRALVLAKVRDQVLSSLPPAVKERLRFVGEANWMAATSPSPWSTPA